jgi:hypothetical protein
MFGVTILLEDKMAAHPFFDIWYLISQCFYVNKIVCSASALCNRPTYLTKKKAPDHDISPTGLCTIMESLAHRMAYVLHFGSL